VYEEEEEEVGEIRKQEYISNKMRFIQWYIWIDIYLLGEISKSLHETIQGEVESKEAEDEEHDG